MTSIELRVHGVSGTPPEDMLGTDRACQVDGDDFGRVFRRADRFGNVLDPNDGIEAYHWGKQTSGSPLQGLWLLLAPFGMVNAAQFMLEDPETASAPSRARTAYWWAGAALRLTGLALTLMFVLTAAIITVDLWAWQRERASTGTTFALALLGPVALLGFYYVVARTRAKLNRPPAAPRDTDYERNGFGRSTGLLRPGFFEGDPDVPALRSLHMAAGLALIALVAFGQGQDDQFGRWGWWGSAVLLVLVAIVVVVLGDPEGSADTRWSAPSPGLRQAQDAARHLAIGLFALGAGAVALAAAYLVSLTFGDRIDVTGGGVGLPPEPDHFGRIDEVSLSVMLVAVTGLLVLLVVNLVLAVLCRSSPARSGVAAFVPYAKGMACTLVATVGVFLGVGFAGAFTTSLATLMSTERRPVVVPELLSRITYAWGLTVVLVVVLGVCAWWDWRRRKAHFMDEADVELGVPTRRTGYPAPRWRQTVARAMWRARLKNRAPCVFATFALFGAVLTVATAVETAPMLGGGTPQDGIVLPGWLSGSANETLSGGPGVMQNAAIAVGALVLSGLAGLLLTLGRKALSGEAARRGTNVIWDVIAFWPRSTHPFVPATYAQRAVPDLEERVRDHLRCPENTVVLCGHSQGSLLAFAALLRLATDKSRPDDERAALVERVRLLTFGSQLQVMFARGFPGYVNHATIDRLYDVLGGRWRNLYRTTDPLAGPVLSWSCRGVDHGHPGMDGRCHIGGPVGSGGTPTPHRREYGPDWRIFDPPNPPASGIPPGRARGETFLPLRGHGDYWRDSAWKIALAVLSR